MSESKHAVFSTTQVAATLSSVILLSNIYLRYSGHTEVDLSNEELMAVASFATPVLCNVWIQWKRFKNQKPIHLFKKKEK